MSCMFYYCVKFDQSLNIWDISNVQDTSYMFYSCESFKQPLNLWNLNLIDSQFYMFYNCDKNINLIKNINS